MERVLRSIGRIGVALALATMLGCAGSSLHSASIRSDEAYRSARIEAGQRTRSEQVGGEACDLIETETGQPCER